MPRHINPNQEVMATAAYNFVPLPNAVFNIQEGIEVNGQTIKPWEQHDQFITGTYSGWISVDIELLTPLFIRGPVTKNNDSEWDKREARLRPDPYTTRDGRAAIPGSSLRGMVCTLVEIISFSKIAPVTEDRPFYRSLGTDRVGRFYRKRMGLGSAIQGGILRRNGTQWCIDVCEVKRVPRALVEQYCAPNAQGHPKWEGQHKECQVTLDHKGRVASLTGTTSGTLVLTGWAPPKEDSVKNEFFFMKPAEERTLRIPDAMWKRFHDDDQISNWQKKAFPVHKPSRKCRRNPGYLREGEPVFFLCDDAAESVPDNPDKLVFFGRAKMFRLPYDKSPSDLVPGDLKIGGVDLAEAIFGRVSQDGSGVQSIKGRVRFEAAVAGQKVNDSTENIIVPKILSSPKPTTFQHYLTQDGHVPADKLTTYLDGDITTIRGHKLYWHRWNDRSGLEQVRLGPLDESNRLKRMLQEQGNTGDRRDDDFDKQHTVISPVGDNTGKLYFSGKISFDNLTDIELGALLVALQLTEGCAHKIGMAKPLGLGSIKISPSLFLTDRDARYRCWSNVTCHASCGDPFVESFSTRIMEHAKATGETMADSTSGIWGIARLQALLHMLEWENRPLVEDTRPLEMKNAANKNEFAARSVLPTPHMVKKQNEPGWPEDKPIAATPPDV